MKRVATRDDVIATTRDLIAQQGIRAIGVDRIAEMLGMSKRTLYQMFDCKQALINACFDQMSRQQQSKVISVCREEPADVLSCARALVEEYVGGLYHVDISFLEDIRHNELLIAHFEESRSFWQAEMSRVLADCKQEGLLLPDIDPVCLADQILNTFFELRIRRLSCREQDLIFARTILRGAASVRGLQLLDS